MSPIARERERTQVNEGIRRAMTLHSCCHHCENYRCKALIEAFSIEDKDKPWIDPPCWTRYSKCRNFHQRTERSTKPAYRMPIQARRQFTAQEEKR